MTYDRCALPSDLPFLEIDHVDRIFPTKEGDYIAISNVDLKVNKGEFVTLIGHSGCGKSTLLNIIAGLDRATNGGIVLEGKEVRKPGPDRMMVFQNHSLLPWLTVRQNIALAVNRVFKQKSKKERSQIVEEHIDLVSLRPAADKYPKEISGGMKQRVGIARALSIRPKLLLLDEPFGALDALTRGRLQEQLMKICEDYHLSVVMITHDVDEALLLSDRIVMLTNGPSAHIGQILEVDLPRPRHRMEIVNNPSYYRMRGELVEFLNRQKKDKVAKAKRQVEAVISRGSIEKVNLTIGFIPLTDCAPLVMAQEKGLFAKHGLEVTLSREKSWGAIADGVREGRLDAAQMVTGMPLAITLGMGKKEPVPVVSSLTLSRNGNAITIAKAVWNAGVRDLASLKQYVQAQTHRPIFGMVHSASMHNLLLRHWLANAGINPDTQVDVVVIPPAQMVSNLISSNIIGFSVGEPWNSRAVHEELGYIIATDLDIWNGHPEKVLGVKADWAEKYPNSHLALTKALLEACAYCQPEQNREEVLEIICQPAYLNAESVYVRCGFNSPYRKGSGENLYLKDFNIFFGDNSPNRSEHLWVMAQMARWNLIPFPSNYDQILDKMLAPNIYRRASEELDLPVAPASLAPIVLADGEIFDPTAPMSALPDTAEIREFVGDRQLV
ncbi:nitrate transport ATP-binding subunits C and D [Synechococcus sp. PCC 7502]|uniref:ABC transporter ATP-binding/substrate-binding protein n=1 Tax=Synechococcus sp. PCC 7502 TaxID=1173263 RepID=UPI00029FEF55|nr:nitrate ABC transporter ATP-binding protein [Synechococcus sp. PCC 7502]AFY72265.1 nitrate transport ATP-binding subunits C and D [Synechococcus sp. PCC 7502]